MGMQRVLGIVAFSLAAALSQAVSAADDQAQGGGMQQHPRQMPSSPYGGSQSAAPSGGDQASSGAASAEGGMAQSQAVRASDLIGKKVINGRNQEIGTVRSVARSRTDGTVNAVVGYGGFLGLGRTDVVIPLTQLRLQGDRLMLGSDMDRDQLKRTARYDDKAYQKVDGETMVTARVAPSEGGQPGASGQSSQAQAGSQGRHGAQGGGAQVSFQQLDTNQDGFISRDEARDARSVVSQWEQIDQNGDGFLDRSEFSAFEQMNGGGQGQGGMGGAQGGQGYGGAEGSRNGASGSQR